MVRRPPFPRAFGERGAVELIERAHVQLPSRIVAGRRTPRGSHQARSSIAGPTSVSRGRPSSASTSMRRFAAANAARAARAAPQRRRRAARRRGRERPAAGRSGAIRQAGRPAAELLLRGARALRELILDLDARLADVAQPAPADRARGTAPAGDGWRAASSAGSGSSRCSARSTSASVCEVVSPSNSRLPASISNSTTPNAQMSARLSTDGAARPARGSCRRRCPS